MKRFILVYITIGLMFGCAYEPTYYEVDYSEIDCNKYQLGTVIDTEEYCKNKE